MILVFEAKLVKKLTTDIFFHKTLKLFAISFLKGIFFPLNRINIKNWDLCLYKILTVIPPFRRICISYIRDADAAYTREVIRMAFEVIKNIVEAENEIDSIKAEAYADAQKIKADARANADALIAEVRRSAKSDEKKAVAKAVEGTKPEVDKILAGAGDVCKQVKATAEKNRQKAVEAVIGKVVGINGDS